MITQQVATSLAMTGDDAGCQSCFAEQVRSDRGRPTGTFA